MKPESHLFLSFCLKLVPPGPSPGSEKRSGKSQQLEKGKHGGIVREIGDLPEVNVCIMGVPMCVFHAFRMRWGPEFKSFGQELWQV